MATDPGDKWQNDLMRRYPQLFGGSGYPTVGEGWQDLLERALKRIAAAVAREPAGSGIQIVQIKEKFGTLRLYFDGQKLSKKALAKIREAIELAEARSACTCEECGNEGRLYDRNGWYLTRCPRHSAGEPVEIKPGRDNLLVVRTVTGEKAGSVTCRRYDRERDRFVEAPLPPDFDEES
jgi:hypothetical protein